MSNLYNVNQYARNLKADALHPFYPAVFDKNIVKDIQDDGILINAYTVDEESHMRMIMELGIDGIITNFPDKLKEIK